MWTIQTRKVFEQWLEQQNDADRENVLAHLKVLREMGPGLSRPYADTLKGSSMANLKELKGAKRGRAHKGSVRV